MDEEIENDRKAHDKKPFKDQSDDEHHPKGGSEGEQNPEKPKRKRRLRKVQPI